MKCSNCQEEMIEDYKLKINNGLIFEKISLAKEYDEKPVKARVCPKCGKVELYTDLI